MRQEKTYNFTFFILIKEKFVLLHFKEIHTTQGKNPYSIEKQFILTFKHQQDGRTKRQPERNDGKQSRQR